MGKGERGTHEVFGIFRVLPLGQKLGYERTHRSPGLFLPALSALKMLKQTKKIISEKLSFKKKRAATLPIGNGGPSFGNGGPNFGNGGPNWQRSRPTTTERSSFRRQYRTRQNSLLLQNGPVNKGQHSDKFSCSVQPRSKISCLSDRAEPNCPIVRKSLCSAN